MLKVISSGVMMGCLSNSHFFTHFGGITYNVPYSYPPWVLRQIKRLDIHWICDENRICDSWPCGWSSRYLNVEIYTHHNQGVCVCVWGGCSPTQYVLFPVFSIFFLSTRHLKVASSLNSHTPLVTLSSDICCTCDHVTSKDLPPHYRYQHTLQINCWKHL